MNCFQRACLLGLVAFGVCQCRVRANASVVEAEQSKAKDADVRLDEAPQPLDHSSPQPEEVGGAPGIERTSQSDRVEVQVDAEVAQAHHGSIAAFVSSFAAQNLSELESFVPADGVLVITKVGLRLYVRRFESFEGVFELNPSHLAHVLGSHDLAISGADRALTPHSESWTRICDDAGATGGALVLSRRFVPPDFATWGAHWEEEERREVERRLKDATLVLSQFPTTFYFSEKSGTIQLEVIEHYDPCSA